MSIDILSRQGHAPVVVMNDDWLPRVRGLYQTPDWTYPDILDTEGRPVMVPLLDETRAATEDAALVYYVAMAEGTAIASISAAPVDSFRTDSIPVTADELIAHLQKMTSGHFVMELVDLSSVGKVEERTVRRAGIAYRSDLPARPKQSKDDLLPS